MNDYLELRLGYDHGLGGLSDYFQAVIDGRALASRCEKCARTWFPPHTLCPEDGALCTPRELDGHGVVTAETRTRTRLPFTDRDTDIIFVLVAMAGADNAAFGRLVQFDGEDATGARVQLRAWDTPPDHPAQALVFKAVKDL